MRQEARVCGQTARLKDNIATFILLLTSSYFLHVHIIQPPHTTTSRVEVAVNIVLLVAETVHSDPIA